MVLQNVEACACKPADYASDQEVKWCPGCGDYSVLANTRKVLAKMGVPRHKVVFVSGIGCSSRFPYYMNTYGFHGIHGRAPTVATGLKLARPDLDVWVITGDGDALSIGGNHFMHLIRRNLDVKVLLFNNRIYGLTKGQYSPTSPQGLKTKTTPMGAPEQPMRPLSVAIGAEATFAARALDADTKLTEYVLERAAKHRGTALVEVCQNCVIFNDGAYEYISDRDIRPDHTLYLEHGKPMIYGKEKDKALVLKGLAPKPVKVADVRPEDVLMHDESADDPTLAFMLSRMRYPEAPEAIGVLRAVERECYGDVIQRQLNDAKTQRGAGDVQKLLEGEETWEVK